MKVFVNKKGAKRIRNGHLWIFRSDLHKAEAAGGSITSVFDESKNFLGKAFYSDKSEISLRFLSLKDEAIDRNFWESRFQEAKSRRKVSGFSAYRLINSEADLIPSLVVDNYNGNYVFQTLSQGSESQKEIFIDILKEQFSPVSIVERNDAKIRGLEGLPLQAGPVFGEPKDKITITQNGIDFGISLLSGQKTGSFLDQRENHFASRSYSKGEGLDCFTFNGGFALNMAKGCDRVLAIDISADAISLAKENASINGIANVEFEEANVFDKLRDLEKAGRRFDTVVLDPPAFVKSRSALRSAIRGYKEINLRALKLLNPGGILITCSCSYHLSEAILLEIIEDSAKDAHRRLHLIEKRTQSSDHPILIGMPESYYLKCLIFRAAD